jgi:hypothetical protein
MKKLFIALIFSSLITSCCLSQLPTQYAYIDETCSAMLPDFTEMVIVGDNCSVVNITQVPMPGIVIQATTTVRLVATDETGNLKAMDFEVVIMDTIAPTMMLDPEWVSYTDKEVGEMYKVFYGWVQEQGDYYNEVYAGTIDTLVTPDTTLIYVNDTMRYFRGTIPIFEYRMDEGYWANETPDLTAWFR